MTQLKIIKCDRCDKEFHIPVDQEPHSVTLKERVWDYSGNKIEKTTGDLCDDCKDNYNQWYAWQEEFDGFAVDLKKRVKEAEDKEAEQA